MHATIPKGIVNSSLISGFPRNLRNVIVRTRQSGFDEFTYLFDLINFIDYQITRLPLMVVAYNFFLFSDKLSPNSCILKYDATILYVTATCMEKVEL